MEALTAEVKKARLACETAKDNLDAILNEGIGALPHPDGSLRTHQAVEAYHKALREHVDAMIQMNHYLLGSWRENSDD